MLRSIFPLTCAALAGASYPFHGARDVTPCDGLYQGTPPADWEPIPTPAAYDAALRTLNMEAVKTDMHTLLTDSKECWPADFGNYGPFFVRLAWHCAGTFRSSDGLGGCGGGRQRFEPERSWEDNANLDKARALLWPLKRKYGIALSWGDAFVLAGTTALRAMGTPIKEMCFGRIDEADGTLSLPLGPSQVQRETAPCPVNGRCEAPLGSTTIGLIYMNGEGPVMEPGGRPIPDPALSVADIRSSFTRMGHGARATVALIGGGHAFGKVHGPCPKGPGEPPKVAYARWPPGIPWVGRCGSGKGNDTYTSGFEGPWTTNPLRWDNEFFKLLLEETWEKHIGPGGKWQWRVPEHVGHGGGRRHHARPQRSHLRGGGGGGNGRGGGGHGRGGGGHHGQRPRNATAASGRSQVSRAAGLMRLTSDMALLADPTYLEIVREFAADMRALDEAFDAAWFDLTVIKGNVWSKEAKCDHGKFPEELRPRHPMTRRKRSASGSTGKRRTRQLPLMLGSDVHVPLEQLKRFL